MIFVLLLLLITGLVTTSLIQLSLMNGKITSNYLLNERLRLTVSSGKRIVDYLEKNDKEVKEELALSYGNDYNIRINIEEINKNKDYIKYIIKANFDKQNKGVYYIVEDDE